MWFEYSLAHAVINIIFKPDNYKGFKGFKSQTYRKIIVNRNLLAASVANYS